MHRIDSAGSVDGAFSDPKPTQGVRGTLLAAIWFNDLQENVLGVLEEAGLPPTKGRARDLADAIIAIAEAAAGAATGDGVPPERLVSTAGLATGGGSLAANRTITVSAASTAETKSGTLTTKAVTPAGLLAALDVGVDVANLVEAIEAIALGDGSNGVPTTRTISAAGLAAGGGDLSANRTITVPAASSAEVTAGVVTSKAITPAALFASLADGLDAQQFKFGPFIVTWGTYAALLSESSIFIPFATAFPLECFAVMPVVLNNTGADSRDTWVQIVGAPTTAGFTAHIQSDGSSGNTCDGVMFIAIGR